MASRLDFISDPQLRGSLSSDYDELRVCLESGAWKGVLVLSGSIVEAVLVDHLVSTGQTKPDPLRMDLADLVTAAQTTGALSARAADLSSVVRSYRNLIHPGRMVRLGETFNEDDARVAASLVDIIIREVAAKQEEVRGLTADQVVSKFVSDSTAFSITDHLLGDVRPDELERLLLDVLPERYFNPPDIETWHPSDDRALERLYREAFEASTDETRTKATKKFAAVLKEGEGGRVRAYEEAFFRATDLQYVKTSERGMIIDHLVSRIFNETITLDLIGASEGITTHLNEKQLSNYLAGLMKAIAYSPDQEVVNAARQRILGEYESYVRPALEAQFLRQVKMWDSFLEQRELSDRAESVRTLAAALEARDDIPF